MEEGQEVVMVGVAGETIQGMIATRSSWNLEVALLHGV